MTLEQVAEVAERKDGKKPSIDAWLGGLSSELEFPNAARDLIRGGKDIDEQMPKSVFRDQNQVNKLLQCLLKVKRYDMDEKYEAIFRRWMIASAAIDGRARKELLMCSAQVVAPSLYGVESRHDRMKRVNPFRRKKKEGEDEQE